MLIVNGIELERTRGDARREEPSISSTRVEAAHSTVVEPATSRLYDLSKRAAKGTWMKLSGSLRYTAQTIHMIVNQITIFMIGEMEMFQT